LDEKNRPMLTKLLTLGLRFEVWDYSRRNMEILRGEGFKGTLNHAPVGFVEELSRIPKAPVQDIDVLFYGSVNERRLRSLDGLRAQGLKVEAVFGVYGAERDALIARAKVVLNMHYYDSSIFEIVRVSYLLANRKAVVAECHPGTEIEPELREAVRAVPYEGLVEACLDLVRNDGARAALEARGHVIFAAVREEAILGAILGGETAPPETISQALPGRLNIESGNDWLESCSQIIENKMKISFIVATYNRPKNLKVLLDCLIAQDEDNWECIVMDEGNNKCIIPNDPRFQHHAVERITLFPEQNNRGTFGLLPKQAGLRYAKYDWVVFPSEDIYYVPQFTSIMKQAAIQNPTIDIIACDFVFDRIGFKVVTTAPVMGFVDVCNYILRKSKIGNVRFSDFFETPYRMGTADGWFIEKIVENGAKFGRLDKILMVHN
jgi:hypothetical protein